MLYNSATIVLFADRRRTFAQDVQQVAVRGTSALLLALLCVVAACFAETTYDIRQRQEVGVALRIRAILEVRGELKMNDETGKASRLPIEVEGELVYDERLIDEKQSPWSRRSVRYYETSTARMKVGTNVLNRTLAADHRLLLAHADKDGSLILCPTSPLTRDELDLVDVPGNSLNLSGLLPAKPVSVGESWKIDADRLAAVVALDAITQHDVTGTLAAVDKDVAAIEIKGALHGAVGGVASKMTLNAKANFDLGAKQLTWFAAAIKEDRAIGHAEPGLDVVARLRMQIAPVRDSENLADGALAGVPLGMRPGADLLAFQPDRSHFRLLHDRRWRAVFDRHDLCVLRFVDRGDLLAQCNVSELPDMEAGKHLSLEEFQADIQRALGSSFGQFVEAKQSRVEDGKRLLRVLVSGTTADVPIQWVYYHVSDKTGRRAALAFTLEAKVAERFAENDRTLAETFEFTSRPQPTEASRNAEKPGPETKKS